MCIGSQSSPRGTSCPMKSSLTITDTWSGPSRTRRSSVYVAQQHAVDSSFEMRRVGDASSEARCRCHPPCNRVSGTFTTTATSSWGRVLLITGPGSDQDWGPLPASVAAQQRQGVTRTGAHYPPVSQRSSSSVAAASSGAHACVIAVFLMFYFYLGSLRVMYGRWYF